jgi:nucleoside-diphosphate-sugar epimerase
VRALITGASGFLGSALARRLASRGDEVRVLLRPGAQLGLLDGTEVAAVEGDVTRPETLPRAVAGVDVVFHLAGLRRAAAREPFFAVNAEGTRNLCEALVGAGGRARLVLASSLAAVGPSRDFPREDAPASPLDWYGESKAEAERIVLSYADRLSSAIARPSRIMGPGDRENLFFFKIVRAGVIVSIGGGPRPISVIDVEEVAQAFVRLAEERDALGEAFFISHQTTTMEGVQEEVARALGKRARRLRVPERAFAGAARGADLLSRLLGRPLPLNRKMAQQLLSPGWTCSTRKAEERLGFRPKIPMSESIDRAARWYREKGWL